ncbi:PTS transporter subunit EIIA [Clostridium tyrobutyricum]|jgi:PTS system fructose-specific IIC component|uniref:PTS system, fructose-specific IIA component / PTS system, fructose-specific IIB component / PTS system, fructose-specific IIC component n=1 Tax=Clostridium tyrobutyricum DIVETGP TaxID=1408889 RepID=W6N6M5_CLOTY|nr:fructose-specific PTS transporter subunit EIIC [Clostridium tyrobutyricum]AND83895.1 PTS system fructose-specific EIIABC component [Clostridium tyrobutyricum]ANP68641.1 PTS fructose transporter subunit IIA [Clostridium tyrobutyricum]MBV4431945.1 fructose-specific PTS transporter subunit EIIC [Clostridium tyrobutyricum]MBV4433955.1 fructose-specific PTS transporter subunit EIIC [Clostridium tyrobutyricum]MBV4447549.1 fructose-specific PTS transporter subunit EIIC [Clostridium tyrobutyricum]
MKITELLQRNTIKLNLESNTKSDVIEELVDILNSAGKLNDKEGYKKEILKREAEFSTGIGEGIAIPHAKTAAVKIPALAFGLKKDGLDYESLDGTNAQLFFMIAAPEGANNEHLDTLARLSSMLMNQEFKNNLLNAQSEYEVLGMIDEQEKAYIKAQGGDKKPAEIDSSEKLVLAVTACPTGIAHTYMAADALNNKGKEIGVNIKVETNGSTGVKNKLTDEEIEKADGIIVAADKQVEMARFDGKKLVQVSVSEAIKDPEGLINKAANGDAPVYHSDEKGKVSNSGGKQRVGFYKHLMSGVSNMLPFVVGGGILIAISFMFGIKSYDPKDPSFNVISQLFHDVGGTYAFSLMVPVLAGFIGMSIADRPGFAPAMVGGFIAAKSDAGFLGGLIAGFIAGYVVLLLKKVFSKLPQSLEGIKPVLLYPLFGILITGVIMLLFIVNPVKAINVGLVHWLGSMGSTNRLILGLILGGMMAIDMGGPVNKAAFAFGIAMIANGKFTPHAAIMAGGMVPPLGIAIATSIFKNRFTKEERETGKTCYVMGATFITEGAIPFAASDPGRVIPASIVGAAVAGGLSMIFNIGLPAPHGGIFVIPVINGNPLLYILAIVIGSFITAGLLGVFKKPLVK